MSQVQGSTLAAPSEPARHRIPGLRDAAGAARGGNGALRALGLVALAAIGALAAWDLRRRGLPVTVEDLGDFAPHLLLVVPLLAGLGMLLGRRPATWAGLLLGAGTWSVLGAVWSIRWLGGAGRRLIDGAPDPRAFATGLTWAPYAALVVLGLVILVTVLALRGHAGRVPCRTRGHQLPTLGAALAALLGPLWVLALVPAMALGLRRPHRATAAAWAGWVVQGVVALSLAANGRIPSSGLPALVLQPSAPTTLLLSLPLLAVAGFAGALATIPADHCTIDEDEPLQAYKPSIIWPELDDSGPRE